MIKLNDDVLLKDLDWYENCICKIEYVKYEIELLKKKERLNAYDQLKINTLLHTLNSPLEYALSQFYKKENFDSNVPNNKNNLDDAAYKKKIEDKFRHTIDYKLFNIIKSLTQNDLYQNLNDMNNNEKHNFINKHSKYVTRTTEFATYPNGIIIKDFTSTQKVDYGENLNESIKSDVEPIYHSGEHYEEEYIFIENGMEVFRFLRDVTSMVTDFVENIKQYLDEKSS